MHAYIVTGGSSDERSDRIHQLLDEKPVSPHDTITIVPEPTSIGVDSMRGVVIRLSIHPMASTCHAVIVRDAHTMTIEAQNAFLKTLEEPPRDAIIILETNQPDALLPTILSRCHTIRIAENMAGQSDEALLQGMKTVQLLVDSSVGERLKLIDTLAKTRDAALAFVDLTIAALHDELTNHGVHSKLRRNEVTKLLRRFLAARAQLLGNITPKLALDTVFLS